MRSAMLDEREKALSSLYNFGNIRVKGNRAEFISRFSSLDGRKIALYGLLVCSLFSSGKVNAQSVEIEVFSDMDITISQMPQILFKGNLHWIRNEIELFSFVSSSSEGMTEVGSQEKGKNSPKESNKAEASFEKQDQVTQEDIEHVKSSLIGMLFASLVMIPLGIMFSECISPRILAKRKRWMKLHELKAKRFHRNNPEKYYVMPRKTFCQWLWF